MHSLYAFRNNLNRQSLILGEVGDGVIFIVNLLSKLLIELVDGIQNLSASLLLSIFYCQLNDFHSESELTVLLNRPMNICSVPHIKLANVQMRVKHDYTKLTVNVKQFVD